MSFLFKSSKKGAAGPIANPTAPSLHATRETIARDPNAPSQIPTPNGVHPTVARSTPGSGSPTPPQSISNSLNSINGFDRMQPQPRVPDERVQVIREEGPRPTGTSSPEQKALRDPRREGSQDITQTPRLGLQTRPSQEANSPYPWSQRRLNFTVTHANPFPRYGAAVNSNASKDGSIYLMGGLINGSTVKGDLWMVECGPTGLGSMTCFPVATTSEGPGPRVGHASLLVGNAFIVFGGDTKMDEGDMLDDTLYLLNTSTKQWSRALPAGPRPPGRYGHTLNILGSKIYIFGGQVEGYFFNDLVAFDLNALQQATNRWEILVQNTIDGGPPHGQIPPARTNHSIVTWQDKLYLFGGTDGVNWYNDVWSYSPQSNSWTQLDCIGYIPSPREGHAAALVGDVMYIFGGRNEEGNDLGDLAAFRISSRRWYTFQNMGPSPSPRSGHSMTTVGKSICVLAGEPSSAPRDPVELGLAYFLDTSKIRYPPDSTTPPNERAGQATRRPSGDRAGSISQPRSGPPSRAEIMDRERTGSAEGSRIRSPDSASRLPRLGQPPPSGPPPQAPGQRPPPQLATRQPTRPERTMSPPNENARPQGRAELMAAPAVTASAARRPEPPMSPKFEAPYSAERPLEDQQQSKPQTYTPSQELPGSFPVTPGSRSDSRSTSRQQQSRNEGTPRLSVDSEPMSRVRKISEEQERPQDSGLGSSPAMHISQYEEMARELELAKQKNAWYASELALARKSGYQSRSADSPVFDESAKQTFKDDDKPLIEALLKMRFELAKVQETIDEQSKNAAERIAEIEKQRDTAITEAVHAKARLAGRGSPQPDGDAKAADRSNEISSRLASSLEAQKELSRRVEKLIHEVEAEKKARELAEDTANAAQKRAAELDTYRQQHTSEIASLRGELHEAQRAHREAAASHSEIAAQHKMLTVDKEELRKKLQGLSGEDDDYAKALAALREAVTASTGKAEHLEKKLEEERNQRDELERELAELRTQQEQQASELERTSRQLRDAEELAEKHAEEARTHRGVVLAGLDKLSEREVEPNRAHEERVTILQQQVDTANGMVREYQAAADAASEKLRRAEERIAGLESYQEQASREGLAIRKQLQLITKENQTLSSEKAELEQKMERHMLETNALSVQHASLKDILQERGISAAEKRRSRALDSPSQRLSTPDLHRIRDLEQQLETNQKTHEELKQQYEDVAGHSEQLKHEYEEKLAALDHDYQAAVKYLRGTEKMLSRLKLELNRTKNDNIELNKQLGRVHDGIETSTRNTPDPKSPEWQAERDKIKEEVSQTLQTSVDEMELRITKMQEQLRSTEAELTQAKNSHASTSAEIQTLTAAVTQSKTDMERLQKENALLEERARDAENKVQLLLDQVESSVDNYRRQSRMRETPGTPTTNGISHQRPRSASDESDIIGSAHVKTHSRNVSATDSQYSAIGVGESAGGATGDEARNSMALDSLASELDALRTHWETTNKNYRLSERYEFDRTPTATTPGGLAPTSGLSDWRRGLEMDFDDDVTRPGTSTTTTSTVAEDRSRSPDGLAARASGQDGATHKEDQDTPKTTPRIGTTTTMT